MFERVAVNILKANISSDMVKLKSKLHEEKEDPIEIILKKLESIEQRLLSLENKADDINTSCKGMDGHISFINSIYTKLRSPMMWILGKTSKQIQPKQTLLPLPPAVASAEAEGPDSDSDDDRIVLL